MIQRLLFFSLVLAACQPPRQAAPNQTDYLNQAREILKTVPIIDTHIDFPMVLQENGEWFKPGYTALAFDNDAYNFDYKKAVKGGLYGAFMSIYIPAGYQNTAGAAGKLADSLINVVYDIAAAFPERFALAFEPGDIRRNFQKGIVSLPMGMENGAPLEKLSDVTRFYQRGIRYVTLTHSRDNHICDASYDQKHTHGGLSEYGKQLVLEMNRIGMMVDVSHLNDASIRGVLAVTRKPLVATHSACRHFTPGYERNLPDELIVAIAQTGGVIQVPFSMFFLSSAHRNGWRSAEKAMKEKGIKSGSAEARAFLAEFAKNSPDPVFANVGVVADHIDHIVKIAGINHVGLGSDFDGVGMALPPDLADVSMYPNLIAELLKRGYSKADIQKICCDNFLRVWEQNNGD